MLIGDHRTVHSFEDCVKNLKEAVESYDRLEPSDLRERWRFGKRMAGGLAVLALSRHRNHISMLDRVGLGETIILPSHVNMPGLPGLPLLAVPLSVGPAVLIGIHSCKASERLRLQAWKGEIVFDNGIDQLTRESLLWTIRDKEGEAHFDDNISSQAAYSALFSRGHDDYSWQYLANNLGVKLNFGGSHLCVLSEAPKVGSVTPPVVSDPAPLLGGVAGAVRTITTEMLTALEEIGIP